MAASVFPPEWVIWLLLSSILYSTLLHERPQLPYEDSLDVTSVEGHPTTMFHAGDARSSNLIIIFPGNPGAPLFYADLALRLAKQADARVTVVGYVGHARTTPSARSYLNLREQTAHAIACAQRAVKMAPPYARVVVAGHSVGAYIALESLRVLPSNTRAALWAPTLAHIGRSANAASLHCLMFHGRTALGAAALILSILPPRMRRFVASLYLPRGVSPLTLAAADSILARRAAVSALYMAADEMETIRETDAAHARAVGGRVLAIFAKHDAWNGPGADALAATQAFGPGADVRVDDELEHGFVLHAEQTQRVIDATAEWLVTAQQAERRASSPRAVTPRAASPRTRNKQPKSRTSKAATPTH